MSWSPCHEKGTGRAEKGAWSSMWKLLATIDVRTAFLQVLRGRKQDGTVIIPPKLFQEMGITTPDEKWILEGPLYGTMTAPREWGDYWSEVLQKMRWGDRDQWRMSRTPAANLWRIEGWSEVRRLDMEVASSQSTWMMCWPRPSGNLA